MPQSVHRPQGSKIRNCGVQTLPLIMHVKNCGNRGGGDGQILTHNELDLTFWIPDYGVKFF